MREEGQRAAFFDLELISWESFEAARAAVERHRSAGDLIVVVLPVPGTDLPGGWGAAGSSAAAMIDDMVRGFDDCLRITADGDTSKSCTVVETMTKLGLDAFRCFGYGDHHDSLRTLGVVGNPRVLGGDPQLAEYARTRGWPVIETASPLAG